MLGRECRRENDHTASAIDRTVKDLDGLLNRCCFARWKAPTFHELRSYGPRLLKVVEHDNERAWDRLHDSVYVRP